MTTLADKFAALLPLITPGPLEVDEDPCESGDHETLIVVPGGAGMPGTWVAHCEHNWNDAYAGERRISWKEAEANAAFYALCSTHAAEIEAALREVGKAKNYISFTDGLEAGAEICGSLAETTYDDADAFEAATGCEAAIMQVVRAQRKEQAALREVGK